MQITTKAIVLSSLKYGDTSLIVRAFTQSDGIKSYLLKGVLASKKAKIRPAYFLPLMQLEIQANHKNKGTLESIRDVRVGIPYQTMHTDIVKNSVLAVNPFAVDDVSVADGRPELGGKTCSPRFEKLELAFSRTTF